MKIDLPAGEATLASRRASGGECASAVVFPELNGRRELPAEETTVVKLPPLPAGELHFACGMGMYRGAVVAR